MSQTRHASYLSHLTAVLLISPLFSSGLAMANELMSKAQYADYSVRYQCAQLKHNDDFAKKEEAILAIEDDFGLTEDNFEAFDELVQNYEQDNALLDDIRARVTKECT